MNIRQILVFFLAASTGLLSGADNKLISKKNSKKTVEKQANPVVLAAPLLTVLTSMRAISEKKPTLAKTEEKEKIENTEKLAEKFWPISQKFFCPVNKTSWTPAMLESIDKTLELAKIFCTQKAIGKSDWTTLHDTLTKIAPEEKLTILNFIHYLEAPKKLQHIIAHNLRKDCIKYNWLYKKIEPKVTTCLFELKNTTWKKIGVYNGSKKPKRDTLFTKPGLLQIPLADGSQTVELATGKTSVIVDKEKKLKSTIKTKTKVSQKQFLQSLMWDKTNSLFPEIKRGSYLIWANDCGSEITINNKTYICPKPHNQVSLTDRYFAVIENFEGCEKETLRAHLVNFEQDRDQELPVLRSCDQSYFGSDIGYDQTKIRHTKNVLFAKGRAKIVAIDLNSGLQTTFRSGFTIKDVYISPDNQYIAICEDLDKNGYTYHVFKLETKTIPLCTYLKPAPLPSIDLYGTSWTPVDTIKSVFSMGSLLLGYK